MTTYESSSGGITSKEVYDLMCSFEQTYKGECFDKEDRGMRARGHYYCNGRVNELFKAYMGGYALAKCMARQGFFTA